MTRRSDQLLESHLLPIEQWGPGKLPNAVFTYIEIAGVDQETKSIVSPRTLLGSEAPSRARKVVHSGDVLVSTVRPNLNAVALVPPELDGAICSTGFAVLRPADSLLSKYLFGIVRSEQFVSTLVAQASGASYPAVTDRQVREVRFSIPPLDEQERIVKLLDEAEALRKLRAEADRRMGELVPALFFEMFGESRLSLAPLGELTSLVTSGVTPRGGDSVYISDGPYFIRSQNVRMGLLNLSDAAHLPEDIFQQMIRVRVQKGDVLLNITGASIGRVAMVEFLDRPAVVSQHVSILRPEPSKLLPEYLSTYLALPDIQSKIMVEQSGASRQALNHQQIRAMAIPVPAIGLQREFANKLASVKQLKQMQLFSNHEVESLGTSLLGQMVGYAT